MNGSSMALLQRGISVNSKCSTWVLDTSFLKGQLSSCLTRSTVSSSQADSSCTPKFLTELRRLDEVVVGANTILVFGETSAGETATNHNTCEQEVLEKMKPEE